MTTFAKLESNRRNARRSTGPRTPEGKLVSSQNSLRHGVLSKQVTLADEDAEEFSEFCARMTDQLAPDGPLEELLVERVTVSAWGLRRIVRLEASVIGLRTREARADLSESRQDGDSLAAGLVRDAIGADALSKISRYERTMERCMYRALHELQRQQAARRGEDVPPPAVLDVEISSVES